MEPFVSATVNILKIRRTNLYIYAYSMSRAIGNDTYDGGHFPHNAAQEHRSQDCKLSFESSFHQPVDIVV